MQLVELKNGETYNGHLVSCDNWMNINLREVICTSRVKTILLKYYLFLCYIEFFFIFLKLKLFFSSLSLLLYYESDFIFTLYLFSWIKDGDRFWRMPECYIRGSTIKYLRIPDEVIDMVKEEVVQKSKGRGDFKGGRGAGQRGRGRGKCHHYLLVS